jgi:hypothetical protein
VSEAQYNVAIPLKAGIDQSEETSAARLRHSKRHINVAIIIEELWETVFSVGLVRGSDWGNLNSGRPNFKTRKCLGDNKILGHENRED